MEDFLLNEKINVISGDDFLVCAVGRFNFPYSFDPACSSKLGVRHKCSVIVWICVMYRYMRASRCQLYYFSEAQHHIHEF